MVVKSLVFKLLSNAVCSVNILSVILMNKLVKTPFLANTAATMAGLCWFLSYGPFLFMQNNYAGLSLAAKMFSSLATNTAMAFGFQVVLMYEGTGEGKLEKPKYLFHLI